MSIVTKSRPARRLALLAVLAVLASLSLPASSFAQASRTWVSGLGDDANPCSRSAPCKTLAGAISKTAVNGEINATDPCPCGALTITKSITISGRGTFMSVLVAGTPGIVINAPGARVTLDNLDVNGLGTGLDGVRIIAAGVVRLQHMRIFNFTANGVNFETSPTSGPASRLIIDDATIDGSSFAALDVLPGSTVGERATVMNSHLDSNNCGIAVGSTCGGGPNGFPAIVNAVNTSIVDNGTGIDSNGSTASAVIAKDSIFGNNTGMFRGAGGTIFSFGDNYVVGNVTDGTPTSTVAPRARDLGRIWRGLLRNVKERKAARHHRR
jgi:hypothetical protein